MDAIKVRKLVRFHDRQLILEEVSLSAPAGAVTAILGGRRSGKMTILRCISGVERIDSGSVLIDGRDVSDLKAGRRDVAMIFHNQALMPHLNVRANIAFPLKVTKVAKAEIAIRVEEVAARFGLSDVLKKRPRALTEDQCHRVSIARAVVRRPGAYLVEDAPPAASAELRDMVRLEVARLRAEDDATILFATEEGSAAMALADRIVVVSDGRVVQSGSKQAVYSRPRNLGVAKMLGAPRLNRLAAKIVSCAGDTVRLKLRGGTSVSATVRTDELSEGERVTLGIWPAHLRCGTSGDLRTTVSAVTRANGQKLLDLDSRAGACSAIVGDDEMVEVGDEIWLQLPPENCLVFDDSGASMTPSVGSEGSA